MAVPGQLTFTRRLGPSARFAIWLAVGIACAVLDARYGALDGLRAGASVLLDPLRTALRAPGDVAAELSGFFTRHRLLQKERDALLGERALLRIEAEQAKALARENAELRALLAVRALPEWQTARAALLYRGHDWFGQKIVIDRGASGGMRNGLPVIDAVGLVGQVSRVFPGSSEVTLVTSPGQLTPVVIERTGQRGLAAGLGQGRLELRYMPRQADVRVGDRLFTSGIDRVYPAALPVAQVTRVVHSQSSPYLRIDCQPLAGLDRARAVLVLLALPGAVRP